MRNRGLTLVYQDTQVLAIPSKRQLALVYLDTPMLASPLIRHVIKFFVIFLFLAWSLRGCLETFPSSFFFFFLEFNMHEKLWLSTFQWSLRYCAHKDGNAKLNVFSWKIHIFQSKADIVESFWLKIAKTLFFKMVQPTRPSSCLIGLVYCAKSGKK